MLSSKKYKHIFFDLDRTLWDFEANSSETLTELYHEFALKEKGLRDLVKFIQVYQAKNIALWTEYAKGTINKEALRLNRFSETFLEFGFEDLEVIQRFSTEYIYRSPRKKGLVTHTFKVLETLQPNYDLHIITNGFEEVQHLKLEHAGIKGFFKNVITSEKAQSKKPERLIFEFSLKCAGAEAHESLLVGDSLEADILGAMNCDIDQVFFNPALQTHTFKPTYEVSCLSQLLDIL